MAEAFWAILLIVIILRAYWKHSAPSRHDNLREAFFGKKKEKKPDMPVTGNAGFVKPEIQKLIDREAQKNRDEAQRQKDIAELKRQGYTDELIAIIIPTINNGQ